MWENNVPVHVLNATGLRFSSACVERLVYFFALLLVSFYVVYYTPYPFLRRERDSMSRQEEAK